MTNFGASTSCTAILSLLHTSFSGFSPRQKQFNFSRWEALTYIMATCPTQESNFHPQSSQNSSSCFLTTPDSGLTISTLLNQRCCNSILSGASQCSHQCISCCLHTDFTVTSKFKAAKHETSMNCWHFALWWKRSDVSTQSWDRLIDCKSPKQSSSAIVLLSDSFIFHSTTNDQSNDRNVIV